MIKILCNVENVQCLIFNFGAHGFNVKSVSPKIKHCTFSTLHRILIISCTFCVCGCFCSSHPCWNVICTITISYKISSNAILFKLPDEVCVQTKPVGDNKEVNKIYSCCVLLTSPCLKELKKLFKKILSRLSIRLDHYADAKQSAL